MTEIAHIVLNSLVHDLMGQTEGESTGSMHKA